jgi:hypothetical protein
MAWEEEEAFLLGLHIAAGLDWNPKLVTGSEASNYHNSENQATGKFVGKNHQQGRGRRNESDPRGLRPRP